MDDADRAQQIEERAQARFARHAALAPRPADADIARLVRCLDCHERIPRARLMIVPYAIRCATCQGDYERRTQGLRA